MCSRRGRLITRLVALLIPWAVIQPVFAADEVRLVVLTTGKQGSAKLKRTVSDLVEVPLREYVKVVPSSQYRQVARQAGVKGRKLAIAATAQRIHEEAGFTHVLFLRTKSNRPSAGRTKRVKAQIEVVLVEAATKDQLFARRYALKRRILTAETAARIVDRVAGILAPESEESAPPATSMGPTPSPPKRRPTPPAADGEEQDIETPGDENEAEAALGSDEEERSEGVAEQEEDSDAPEDDGDEEEVEGGLAARRVVGAKSGYGMRFSMGPTAMRREALLDAAGGGETPCYCATDGRPNPFFAAAQLRLDYFPWSNGREYLGFGFHAESTITRVKTRVPDDGETKLVASSVFTVAGGPSYRWRFPIGGLAPELELRLGYGYYRFPLSRGAFPGLAYGAPYAGGEVTLPFFDGTFAVLVGGTYRVLVKGYDEAQLLGSQKALGGTGFRGEGGLRVTFAPIVVTAIARFDQYDLPFSGDTGLFSVPQFKDVKLRERLVSGFLTVGMVL